MEIYSYSFLILLLPALSFVILALAGMKMSHKTAGLIGTTSLGLVTVLSYLIAFAYFGADRLEDGTFATIVPYNFTWLPLGHLHFDMGILLDPISVMMLIVISTVSLMVHIYSFGYMHGEKGFQRYYAFLSLFTMSMLGLVVATNIFQMYTFWELVGVSSYLLIGFYYPLKPAIAASKKAFIVTRFADMFFLIGILLFGYYTESFSFSFAGDIVMGEGTTPFIAGNAAKAMAAGAFILPTALVLMFIGGAGKSAMFPLHIWLPDAMEGPTPVSALIHAATMVVAGVFQIARMFPLWVEYAQSGICSASDVYHRLGGCVHRILCCCGGLCPERHQACAGFLNDFSDCLHDGGTWRITAWPSRGARQSCSARFHGWYVPLVHPRYVQGLSVLGSRLHHPCRSF